MDHSCGRGVDFEEILPAVEFQASVRGHPAAPSPQVHMTSSQNYGPLLVID